jgi:hypothetical protein
MEKNDHTVPCFRFGVFDVDPRAGELRKSGTRISLQGQPLQVLVALLERPGEVVTREDLRRRIWLKSPSVTLTTPSTSLLARSEQHWQIPLMHPATLKLYRGEVIDSYSPSPRQRKRRLLPQSTGA